MNLSFKNRIALLYLLSTATLTALLLLVIYSIVYTTVFHHLNNDIEFEANKHRNELQVLSGIISFRNKAEWLEREHRAIEVNPVFVQVIDRTGRLVDKSPNLKEGRLSYDPTQSDFEFFNTELSGKAIRQVQVAIRDGDQPVGHLLIAMSLEDAQMVLNNLRTVLLFAFPIVLLILFLIARLIAGRSIAPVSSIIRTANKISSENLNARIEIPRKKDELHTLVLTINDLLRRIENMIEREKRFTSDASHQLRTPLAVMKGTLEVLIRKPREPEVYVEKIRYCVSEIDRMNRLVDQLLLLARFESQKEVLEYRRFDLVETIDTVLQRLESTIRAKELSIQFEVERNYWITSDFYMLDIIFENLLSNAVKYSPPHSIVSIQLEQNGEEITCVIEDHGVGMRPEELAKVFDRFYRSDALEHPEIKGNGLGLSIVKRMCDLLKIEIRIESEPDRGARVRLLFPPENLPG